MKCRHQALDPRRQSADLLVRPAFCGSARLGLLGAILLSVVGTPGAIFDYTAPLTNISATAGAGSVNLQVFDPAIITVVTNNVPSGSVFDLTTQDGVAAWSSGTTIRCYTYDPTRRIWVGDTATTGTTSDLRTTNGIVTWTSGTIVYGRVYDRARGVWKADSINSGTPQNLRIVDGVVAWSATGSVYARVYDPARGGWMGTSVASSSASDLQNTNGVVAWSSGTTVNYLVYDAARGAWRNGSSANSASTFDLRNANGVVAWSVGHVVSCRIYDPSRNAWMPTSVDFTSGQTFNLAVANNAVTWTVNSVNYTRGYNPNTGAWYVGVGLPLSYFAVSTNSGNAPFLVSFIDMSIGGTSWTWNFGDGIGSSGRRSPTYQYTSFGQFNATLTVSGVGNSSTNQLITTDTVPPSGTILINSNAVTAMTNLVTLTLMAADNSGTVTAMRFSNDNTSNWSNWVAYATSYAWRLSAGDGVKTVYAQFRDSAGNVSAVTNDTIVLDTTPAPVVSFVSTNVQESAGSVTIRVVLDHAVNRPVSVSYSTTDGTATAGSDYTFKMGRLDFPALVTAQSVIVPILDDTLVEPNETFTLTFSDPTNCVIGPSGTVTILDDELATVSFASTNFNFSEGAGSASIAVRLNAASGRTVTVRYFATNGTALAGSDFMATNGLLTFSPGQTNLTFSVPIINDTLDELSETVSLRLTNATNAILSFPTNATLTVLDDDAATVSFSRATYPVFEDEGVAVIQVWLSKPFSQEVGVDYSAFGGTATPGFPGDYFATSGRLTFPQNTTNRMFFVNLVNDSQAEPDKTIHLSLDNITGALPGAYIQADILLYDDDGAPRLLSPRLTNGLFQTTLRGKTGQVFSIEFSTDLVNWSALTTLTNATGSINYTDPQPATNQLLRFYRSVLP